MILHPWEKDDFGWSQRIEFEPNDFACLKDKKWMDILRMCNIETTEVQNPTRESGAKVND